LARNLDPAYGSFISLVCKRSRCYNSKDLISHRQAVEEELI
jgi:hypothetical protein